MKQEDIQIHVESFKDQFDHDYDVIKKDEYITLSRSQSELWTNPGEVIGTLLDDGNNISITLDSVPTLELDYVAAQELLVLLLANNDAKMKFLKIETIKIIN